MIDTQGGVFLKENNMKAKIIKTGEIVDVYHETQHGQISCIYKESVLVNGRIWNEDELDFKCDEYVTNWEEVRIKAAIAAMQGLISHQKGYIEAIRFSREIGVDTGNILACTAVEYADALIKKLKGE